MTSVDRVPWISGARLSYRSFFQLMERLFWQIETRPIERCQFQTSARRRSDLIESLDIVPDFQHIP